MTIVHPIHGSATITIDGAPPVVVLRASGPLDEHSAPAFEAALSTAIEAGAVALQIDLSDVPLMAPTFVSTLLRARERVRDLWCEPVSTSVEHVLDATGAAVVLGARGR